MIDLVSDSSISISKEDAKKLGLNIIPLNYSLMGVGYKDDLFETQELLKNVTSLKVSPFTAMPAPADFSKAFKKILEKGNDIICFTLSSRLSGTFDSASLAKREIGSSKIHIIDSQNAVGGIQILAGIARELEKQSKSTKEIVEILEAKKKQISTYFSVDDVDFLRKSGRLGHIGRVVSTALNQKPIFKFLSGTITQLAAARGRLELLQKLASLVPKNATKIIIPYIASSTEAQDLSELLKAKCPSCEITLSGISSVVALHTGWPIISVTYY